MSLLDANGSIACAKCGETARAERDRLVAENAELRAKLVMHESVQKHNEKLINSEREKNKKLQELAKYAILCSEGDVRCEACPYHDKTAEPHIICTMRKAAAELGIEVSE